MTGVELSAVKGNKCPFCGQAFKEGDLITTWKLNQGRDYMVMHVQCVEDFKKQEMN